MSAQSIEVSVQKSKVEKPVKEKIKFLKKLDPETAKLLSSLKEKANRKSYGRKVTDSELLAVGLSLVKPEHLKLLQDKTLSEQDRLKIAHEEFQKKNGKLSLDQFIGKLLRGETKHL